MVNENIIRKTLPYIYLFGILYDKIELIAVLIQGEVIKSF